MKIKLFNNAKEVAWTLLGVHMFMVAFVGYLLWSCERMTAGLRDDKSSQAKMWSYINNLPNVTNGITQIENIEERAEKWRKMSSILAHNWIHSEKAQHHFGIAFEAFVQMHKNSCLYALPVILLSAIGPVWLLFHRKSVPQSGS